MSVLLIHRRGSTWGPGRLCEVHRDGNFTVLTDENGDELRFDTEEMLREIEPPPLPPPADLLFFSRLKRRRGR